VAFGTAQSTFTHLLTEIINPNIQQVFFAQEPHTCSSPQFCRAGDFTLTSKSASPISDTAAPVRMCYGVANVTHYRTFEDKLAFLKNCPGSEVALAAKCPMEESDATWTLVYHDSMEIE